MSATEREDPGVRRATITDVAAEAGASRSTASRALTGQGYVSPQVRDRVRKAAKRLGYVPDAMARGLKRKITTTFGLLVSDLRNSFYAEMAAGASRAAKDLGFTIMLADTNGRSVDELAAAQTFVAQRVAGVIVTPVSAPIIDYLVAQRIPTVEVDRTFGRRRTDSVTVSNADGVAEATQHLVDLGHRRIALIIDETDWTTGDQRQQGFRAVHRDAELPFDPTLVVHSGWDAAAAERATTGLLTGTNRPTAVFAANNVIAEGVWRSARRLGLRVPGDLSVVAFDDAPWMSLVDPGLTTVAQDPSALGATAVRQLVDRIDHPESPSRSIVLATELRQRGSVARPASVG